MRTWPSLALHLAATVALLLLIAGQPAAADCSGVPLTVGGFPPSYPLLDGGEIVHNNESRSDNYDTFIDDLYDQTANPNITRALLIDGQSRQVPPWFNVVGPSPMCDDDNGDGFLNTGGGIVPSPTLNPANYLVNGDELSELAVVTSMSGLGDRMWEIYRTYEAMLSPNFAALPCWLAHVSGSTMSCILNGTGVADTATDVTVRFGLAFYLAANNSRFPSGDRATYLQAANTIAAAHLTNEYRELSEPCPVSPLTGASLCHFVYAGAVTAAGDGVMYAGYYQDIVRFLLAAYSATGQQIYLERAAEVVDQFLIASGFNGVDASFGCKKFRWDLDDATPTTIVTDCPADCSGTGGYVWDDADAPRALWMPDALRAHDLVTGGASLPPAYQALRDWGSAVASLSTAHTTTCSCLRNLADASLPCFCGPGHFEIGLGLGLQLYLASSSVADKLDTAMGHYLFNEKRWDFPPNCFWLFRGVRTVKALAAAIGLDEAIFSPPTSSIFADGFASGDTTAWSAAVP